MLKSINVKKSVCFFRYLLFILFLPLFSRAQTVNIYVSPVDTTGTGQSTSSPTSISKARAIVKVHPQTPYTIWLESGAYPSISLDASDSRPVLGPVTYQSIVANGAYFQPEIALNMKGFTAIPDSIKARIIDATAKTKVMQMSLASYNFPDENPWPTLFSIDNLRSPKFYKNGYPMAMSRYPSNPDSTMTMRQVITKGSANSVPGGSFKYRDGRGKYWLQAINDGGLYLSGNWQYPWEMSVIKTLSLNTADSLIVQSTGISGGIGTEDASRLPSGTEPYYALNLVEEINAEGQWSFNFRTKMLYMWVPASGTVTCSGNAGMPAISLTGVQNTKFINIGVKGGSGNGVELNSCNSILLAGMHISDCSRNGIVITDGSSCTVQSNDIDSVGAGGVIISTSTFSSDQAAVKTSWHQVINNHIYSFAREAFLYSAAVDVSNAIGTYVAYNKIHDSPHVGVLFGGNNNVLEYNEVYDVVKKYTDMGAFYRYNTSRAWTARGNKLHANFIHDAPLANGIYEDDYSSGDSSAYNIIANTSLATFNNYGYFNAFVNNIYVHDTYPITCMVEATSDAQYVQSYDSLKKIWNGSAAYKKAYPECVDMVGSASRNAAYTSRIWPVASGNVFVSNPGVLSNIDDSQLFGLGGITNALFAQLGAVFTKWGLVFENNFKLVGKMTNMNAPFSMDSLRSSGAFGHSNGTDWHIYRIGLHRDAYRTDISSTQTAGIAPVLTLTCSSTNNFTNPGVLIMTAGVKEPNANATLPSMWFTDGGAVIHGVIYSKKAVTFDSVVYTGLWTDPPAGTHHIAMVGGDAQYWQYTSNTVAVTIKAATTTASVARDSVSSGSGSLVVRADTSAVNTDSSQVRGTATRSDTTMRSDTAARDSAGSRQLTLFPNPAKDLINVAYTSSKAGGNTSVIIYDATGRALLKREVSLQQGLNEMTFSLQGFNNGVYWLVMENQGGGVLSRRFIVQH